MKAVIKKILNAKYFQPANRKEPEHIAKVSVIVPNYNYANFIEARLNSILNQTYPIYELIVLDDCSSDNSVSIIEKFIKNAEAEHPETKICFIQNAKNSGNVFKQWKKGLSKATGDFIWIAEADDLSNKYFLNAAMRGFEADSNVVLSYTESMAIDNSGRMTAPDLRRWASYKNTSHWNKNYINDGKNELANYLVINNTIINVSAVVFKNIPEAPDFLSEAQRFKLAGDWWFYFNMLLHGKISYNAESLNYFRLHEGSVTKTTNSKQHYEEILMVQKNITKSVDVSHEVQNRIKQRNKDWCVSLHI